MQATMKGSPNHVFHALRKETRSVNTAHSKPLSFVRYSFSWRRLKFEAKQLKFGWSGQRLKMSRVFVPLNLRHFFGVYYQVQCNSGIIHQNSPNIFWSSGAHCVLGGLVRWLHSVPRYIWTPAADAGYQAGFLCELRKPNHGYSLA